jgi:hypothetical protein
MNERDIELTRKAGWPDSLVAPIVMAKLAEFANIIRADQKEIDAQVCDGLQENWADARFAAAIRARGDL